MQNCKVTANISLNRRDTLPFSIPIYMHTKTTFVEFCSISLAHQQVHVPSSTVYITYLGMYSHNMKSNVTLYMCPSNALVQAILRMSQNEMC